MEPNKPRDGYVSTEDECLRFGGHCFEGADYMLASNPPISVRVCKHCGKRQHGHPQDSMRWVDATS